MRVLVTRPAHSGERTAQRLRALGHEPLLLPLSRPVHDTAAARQALETTGGAIAITSAEAVRALQSLGQALTPHLSRSLFAVGEATADQARELGFHSVTASSGSGRELAELIAANNADGLLYLAGSPRAETFEMRLTELGRNFSITECYQMEPVTPDPGAVALLLTENAPEAVLFYSRQTAGNFFHIPQVESLLLQLPKIRLICLSNTVAEAVPPVLEGALEISPMPDEKSLLSLL
ncbi:uroporphyrinogen-III synthase [Rhizobium sp. BK529]|uniref:uroporphyrinogen-III synthase n=1 Tax=unclassified Rhizobium TaxID=2613769 RepID=UPI00104E9BAE|nr:MULTISPECIES: uroporphyrinogen-III synthase [unclassified Rhizobium]MBB3594465.1 uroporphyrinogen-III synthase [Rhizobium sp. BK529]TCS02207.1 uroporphyrinogen-III synthase [Rhizobium sp. BK418]